MEDLGGTMERMWEVTFPVRRMFYLVGINETSLPADAAIPKYIEGSMPFFGGFVLLEAILLWLKGRESIRISDGVMSVASGLFLYLPKMVHRAIEVVGYSYVYEHWRLTTLPWDSPWTWVLSMIGVDFGFYWFHRAAHEINIFWAAHQVHHSAEDYNLTTALRKSVLQQYTSWIFYLPMALCIPTNVFLVHSEMNLLYQFWIHTELINSLGPLEYVLNTPSHHRVHHGRNRYCIDKNYGGVLIIFDRMFGTFAAESEPVAYGLTHSLETWNPIEVQIFHLRHMWNRFVEVKGLCNKLKVIFYGPGWTGPASPRLGRIEDIPDVHPPVTKLQTNASALQCAYVLIHFLLVNGFFLLLLANKHLLSQFYLWIVAAYLLWSLTNFGFIFDCSKYAIPSEMLRLVATPLLIALVATDNYFSRSLSRSAIVSLVFWLWQAATSNALRKSATTSSSTSSSTSAKKQS